MSSEAPRHASPDPDQQPGLGYALRPEDHVPPPGGPARGSASVPVARAAAPVDPDRYEQASSQPVGIPTQPVRYPAGPGPQATADARATGTAPVSEDSLLPAHQLPALPSPVPRVYGRPSAPQAYPAAVAPPQSYPPAAAAPPPYPPVVASPPPGNAPAGPVGATARVPVPSAQPMSQPAMSQPAMSQPAMSQPAMSQPPMSPPMPGSGGFGAEIPRGEYERFTPPPAEGSGSHTGLLIAVGGVVLVAVVGLVAFLWPKSGNGPQFPVNSCVRQSAGAAIAADCSAAGAFTVVSQVERRDQCPDPAQPYVELGAGTARILCLAPAAGSVVPSSTPSPGTT